MDDPIRSVSKASKSNSRSASKQPDDAILPFKDDDSYDPEHPDADEPPERVSAVRFSMQKMHEDDEREASKKTVHSEAYEETPIERMTRGASFILPEDEEDGVRNHEFVAWLEEDRRHGISCRTLPLTLLTWLIFLFVIWGHGNIPDTFRMRECLQSAITEVKARHTVTGAVNVESVVSLHSVTSVDEMWSWIEGGLVPAMAGPATKPGFVRTFNKVIGSIQLRESRFKYGDCQVGTELAQYYRQNCHSADEVSEDAYGYGATAVSSNATSTQTNVMSSNSNMSNISSLGDASGQALASFLPASTRFANFKLSEHNQKRFFSWLDVQVPHNGQALANSLRTNTWINDGTKSLEVIIVLFNAEIQCYGHINVKLLLERGGLIKVDLEVRTLWATMYKNIGAILIDVVWVLCVLKFFANSTQKAVDNKRAKNCWYKCCTLTKEAGGGYWLMLDWIGIVLALTMMLFLFPLSGGYQNLAKQVGGLYVPTPPPNMALGNATAGELFAYQDAWSAYYAATANLIEDIEGLLWLKQVHQLLMFWYGMVFLLRWFKGFRGQARMAQITSTLSSAGADLIHFGIIFLVLFINFALAGHCLFGHEVPEWSSPTKALQSAIAMAWGRVDFTPMYEIAPYSALIWLFGYVLSMTMLSMNMVLAIIADHYGGVFHANNAGDKGYSLPTQLRMMAYENWWNFSYSFRTVYRILWTKWFPYKMQNSKFVPRFPPEETRREIPYDTVYAFCSMDEHAYISVKLLRSAGCDKATAKHLIARCEDEVLRHLPEHYPLPLLFEEFDESMEQYYDVLDHFSNELRTWFAEKSVATAKMIPRQTKLDGLSSQIEIAQHIEHKHHHHHRAEHMEGEGVHHHHHRRNKGDRVKGDDSESQSVGTHSRSQSNVTSRVQSLAPSRAQSRSPSKTH